MQSESTGTLTAICMLIPLVSVPYFAIRGTQDLNGNLPSLDGTDDVAFASTTGLNDESLDDAPPFPSGDSILVDSAAPAGATGWSDPFDTTQTAPVEDHTGVGDAFTELKSDVSDRLDEHSNRAQSGLGGATVTGGSQTGQLKARELPIKPVSDSRASKSGVAAQWEQGVAQLKAVGMRNYRVESLQDKSIYYVSAFFPDQQSGVTRRFEGEGKHPLTALQSVTQQVREWRSGKSW